MKVYIITEEQMENLHHRIKHAYVLASATKGSEVPVTGGNMDDYEDDLNLGKLSYRVINYQLRRWESEVAEK